MFRGSGKAGSVAIKRLNLTAEAAAFRELKIGEVLGSRTLDHVVPILDCGQDALSDRYFLVMPICEQSLQDKIAVDAPLSISDVRKIVLDILAGLTEVNDIVHRDLKPGNILLLNDRWRLADFGIAKFVEDSTSLNTLRENLTPAYGAPEQWLGEAPTHATDVYALGCIIHALITGHPPFLGSHEQVRDAHLSVAAPPLPHDNKKLIAFVTQMLRKSPAVRPTIPRCIDVFGNISDVTVTSTPSALSAAAAHVAAKAAEADAARRAAERWAQQQDALTKEAEASLVQIKNRLFSAVASSCEEITTSNGTLKFGDASLEIGQFTVARRLIERPNLTRSGWNVCAYCTIHVKQASRVTDSREFSGFERIQVRFMDTGYTWGATLVFAATPEDPSYRWREVSFWRRSQFNQSDDPFAVPADDKSFDEALSRTLSTVNVAFGPEPIDAEDEQGFQHRWIFLLSKAAMGQLQRPSWMPIPYSFFDG